MVLTSADLGGAKVTSQTYYKDNSFPSVISYARELEKGRFRSVRLEYVDSEAEIGTSATTSAITLSGTKKYMGTKQAQKDLREAFEDENPLGSVFGSVRMGKPRNLGVGKDSFDVLVIVRMFDERFEYHLAAFRVERALGILGVIGPAGKRVPLPTVTALGKLVASRMAVELAPRNTSLPSITGTPAVGQTLRAEPGTWTGSPTRYAYQWQRCDPSGASCADLPAATGQAYAVVDADFGTTIRVQVTATNEAGNATATSAPTALVQAAGPPASTSPPTITGTAQVGQTLVGSTGVWSGTPTSFAFQWRRCEVGPTGLTGPCVDIPDATSGTYVVGEADRGKRIQLVVAAFNSAGYGTAASEFTATVP